MYARAILHHVIRGRPEVYIRRAVGVLIRVHRALERESHVLQTLEVRDIALRFRMVFHHHIRGSYHRFLDNHSGPFLAPLGYLLIPKRSTGQEVRNTLWPLLLFESWRVMMIQTAPGMDISIHELLDNRFPAEETVELRHEPRVGDVSMTIRNQERIQYGMSKLIRLIRNNDVDLFIREVIEHIQLRP